MGIFERRTGIRFAGKGMCNVRARSVEEIVIMVFAGMAALIGEGIDTTEAMRALKDAYEKGVSDERSPEHRAAEGAADGSKKED